MWDKTVKKITKAHVGYQIKGTFNHSLNIVHYWKLIIFGRQGQKVSENFDKIKKNHVGYQTLT